MYPFYNVKSLGNESQNPCNCLNLIYSLPPPTVPNISTGSSEAKFRLEITSHRKNKFIEKVNFTFASHNSKLTLMALLTASTRLWHNYTYLFTVEIQL